MIPAALLGLEPPPQPRGPTIAEYLASNEKADELRRQGDEQNAFRQAQLAGESRQQGEQERHNKELEAYSERDSQRRDIRGIYGTDAKLKLGEDAAGRAQDKVIDGLVQKVAIAHASGNQDQIQLAEQELVRHLHQNGITAEVTGGDAPAPAQQPSAGGSLTTPMPSIVKSPGSLLPGGGPAPPAASDLTTPMPSIVKSPGGVLPGFQPFDTSKIGTGALPKSNADIVKEVEAGKSTPGQGTGGDGTPAAGATPQSIRFKDRNGNVIHVLDAPKQDAGGPIGAYFQPLADKASSPEEKAAAEKGQAAAQAAIKVPGVSAKAAIGEGMKVYEANLPRKGRAGSTGGGGAPQGDGLGLGLKVGGKINEDIFKALSASRLQENAAEAKKALDASTRASTLLQKGSSGLENVAALDSALRSIMQARVTNSQLQAVYNSDGYTESFFNNASKILGSGQFDEKFRNDLQAALVKMSVEAKHVLEQQAQAADTLVRQTSRNLGLTQEQEDDQADALKATIFGTPIAARRSASGKGKSAPAPAGAPPAKANASPSASESDLDKALELARKRRGGT